MKCWYCGKNTMVEAPDLGSGWFRCGECGATWIKMPKPTFYGLVVERVDEMTQETKYRPRKRRVRYA